MVIDELRDAVRNAGILPVDVARRAGVNKSVLSRLLAGGTMTMENAEKVAEAVGYSVILKRHNKRKGH